MLSRQRARHQCGVMSMVAEVWTVEDDRAGLREPQEAAEGRFDPPLGRLSRGAFLAEDGGDGGKQPLTCCVIEASGQAVGLNAGSGSMVRRRTQ